MAGGALLLLVSIGSLYFIPLSLARGFFTLGESGKFNYIVHVNRAGPTLYLQTSGSARGSFAHSPEKIFSSPPAYAFPVPGQVTHPLRFDPSNWIEGVQPHFVLWSQANVIVQNVLNFGVLLVELSGVIATVLALAYFSPGSLLRCLLRTWPIWLVGLAGCAMYVPVHVESRYVAGFIALFWLGIIAALQVPHNLSRKLVTLGTMAIAGSLLFPLLSGTYTSYLQTGRGPNVDSEAAAALHSHGIYPGDHVARISPTFFSYDIAMERIARVQVSAEVDFEHAKEFWSSSPATQNRLLQTFASHGARAVIATSPQLTPTNQADWTRLGSTQYWVWLPSSFGK
jgi:hypothetical protein